LKNSNEKKLSFEEAIKKLEQIVDELESDSINLQDLLKKYEEGVALSEFCKNQLNAAEEVIDKLVVARDGEFTLKELKIKED
jgi:exodeoxyribonuclease VII small subunit